MKQAFSIASALHPEVNQDSYFLMDDFLAGGVFDGVGGMAHGDKASSVSCEAVNKQLLIDKDFEYNTKTALEQARMQLTLENKRLERHEYMDSTAVVCYINPEGCGNIAWCGDSRAYGLTNEGRLSLLTRDHNLLFSMEQDKLISKMQAARINNLIDNSSSANMISLKGGKKAWRQWVYRNYIFSSVGQGVIEMTYFFMNDYLGILLTTDGVHDNLTMREMEQAIYESSSDSICQNLVEKAKERSESVHDRAKPDDITALFLSVD